MEIVYEIKRLIDRQSNLWSTVVTCDKNHFLTREKEIEHYLYFIVKGTVRVFFEDEKDDYTVRLGYPNSFICSFDSFVNQTPSLCNVQALKNCEFQAIDRNSFMDFITFNPERQALWNKALSEIIWQQVKREVDLLTTQPLERFNRLLDRSPHVFQEIPHKYIASYLRMAPETLSRLLKG